MALATNRDLGHRGAVGRKRQTPTRPEGLRPIAAAFAVFALLIQALLPSAAMAAQSAGGQLIICTIAGAKSVKADAGPQAPPKGFAGMPCQDCLAASVAAVAPPLLTFEPAPTAIGAVENHAGPAAQPPPARAPPRRLGQGPPAA
jgi:hypothetical protein